MAIKYNKSKIRLWKGIGKLGTTNIGIRFNKGANPKEISKFYKVIESILNMQYGKGVK